MIVLLSPAKTLDLEPVEVAVHSTPRMLKESRQLVKVLKKQSAAELKQLMKVSDKLAELNVERYQKFKTPFTVANAKPSVLTFKGDVYTGLEASDFSEEDHAFAQQHLRILSGLYGLLKPLDLMQAYRLEMGTSLKNGDFKNLYEFWGDKITKLINKDLKEVGTPIVVNLASKEYFHSVKPKGLKGELYNINFKEDRNGVLKVISFNAKKARGVMARQIIKYKITDPAALKDLEVMGYTFNEGMSTERDFLFTK